MDRVMIDAPFAVIVDYAHTPDALVNILSTARPLTKGRLICVFGCGGDRDRAKRPLMGGVVAEHADEAIVTSDNPRSERPVAIIDEICAGIPLDFPHVTIPDRKTAIEVALQNAKEGDCVVIAGKGHEDYQEINGVKHHFDDKEIVETLYLQMGK
jgi:UDP-N-acetylmuramoyl-L-alanyl-D-glutamate--2,6-diaminopimelate ligase